MIPRIQWKGSIHQQMSTRKFRKLIQGNWSFLTLEIPAVRLCSTGIGRRPIPD